MSRRNLARRRLSLRTWGPLTLCVSVSVFAAEPAASPMDGIKDAIRLKQFAHAATELQRLAAAGNPDAQYLLGVFYLNGLNGPGDAGQARVWMEKAAAQGNARAAASLKAMGSAADGVRTAGEGGAAASVRGGVAGTGGNTVRTGAITLLRPQDYPDATTRHEALWLAATHGDLPSVQALSDHDSVTSHDDFGRGALDRAAAAGHTDIAESLIHSGAPVDAPDQYGITALMLAARAGHSATVGALVHAGANV